MHYKKSEPPRPWKKDAQRPLRGRLRPDKPFKFVDGLLPQLDESAAQRDLIALLRGRGLVTHRPPSRDRDLATVFEAEPNP